MNRITQFWTAGALIGVALIACDTPETQPPAADSVPAISLPRDTAALFQTDSLAYHLVFRNGQYEGTAGVTFRNRMADTAYFVNCNGATGFTLERAQGDTWATTWVPPMNACLSPPIIVPPGDSIRRTVLVLDGFQPDSAALQRSPNDTSVYRIVWTSVFHHYGKPRPFGTVPPLENRVTNRFMLIGAPR